MDLSIFFNFITDGRPSLQRLMVFFRLTPVIPDNFFLGLHGPFPEPSDHIHMLRTFTQAHKIRFPLKDFIENDDIFHLPQSAAGANDHFQKLQERQHVGPAFLQMINFRLRARKKSRKL